jgi:hypothetical protein
MRGPLVLSAEPFCPQRAARSTHQQLADGWILDTDALLQHGDELLDLKRLTVGADDVLEQAVQQLGAVLHVAGGVAVQLCRARANQRRGRTRGRGRTLQSPSKISLKKSSEPPRATLVMLYSASHA